MRKLIMLDFDGTLVPIADSPDAILVPVELPGILETLLAQGHKVVIITGRQAKGVKKHLGKLDIQVVGLHGIEWPGAALPVRHSLIVKALRQLKPLENKYPGLYVEDKRSCIAVHYRKVPKKKQKQVYQEVRILFDQLINESAKLTKNKRLSLLDGNLVLELRPIQASKAHAVAKLMKKYRGLHPIYMGDDATDEEAFAIVAPAGTTVRVGRAKHTLAKHRLPNVRAALKFLQKLALRLPLLYT